MIRKGSKVIYNNEVGTIVDLEGKSAVVKFSTQAIISVPVDKLLEVQNEGSRSVSPNQMKLNS